MIYRIGLTSVIDSGEIPRKLNGTIDSTVPMDSSIQNTRKSGTSVVVGFVCGE